MPKFIQIDFKTLATVNNCINKSKPKHNHLFKHLLQVYMYSLFKLTSKNGTYGCNISTNKHIPKGRYGMLFHHLSQSNTPAASVQGTSYLTSATFHGLWHEKEGTWAHSLVLGRSTALHKSVFPSCHTTLRHPWVISTHTGFWLQQKKEGKGRL